MSPLTLKNFKSAGRGKSSPLVAPVTDEAGAKDYELRLAGPAPLIKRCFADSKFDVSIDPKGARSAVIEKQTEDSGKQRAGLGSQPYSVDSYAQITLRVRCKVTCLDGYGHARWRQCASGLFC